MNNYTFKGFLRLFNFVVIYDVSSAFGHCVLCPRVRDYAAVRVLHFNFLYFNLFYELGTAPQSFMIFMSTVCEICCRLRPSYLIMTIMKTLY